MRILSIDIGIRNLGICILECEEGGNTYNLISWKNLNLCEEKDIICSHMISEKLQCKVKAKFLKNEQYFCKKHATKTKNTLSSSDLDKYKQLNIENLIKLCNEYGIVYKNCKNKKNFNKRY